MTNKTTRNATLLNSSSLFVLGTASVLLGSGPAQAFDANALPTGGSVTGGAASIATSGNTLTVNQSSNRAIIDWRSFNIGANAQANFVQPGTSSIAVNRVNGSTDPSRIDGGLHANGQVWVLNPNGVFFGKTARVDAAGVVATTANINDKAFMAGSNKLQMTGGDHGQVVNEGHISVGEGGLAAFVAPSVRNSGTIRARLGKVTLAAGDTYTLDLAGDRLVEIGLGSDKAVVDQSGKIVNAGGVIEISAKAAGQVVDAVINTSGVTDASSVRTAGGKIILGADVINVASTAAIKADGVSGGQITAVANKTGNYAGSWSAQGATGDGGQIETSGATIHIDNKIAVNTKSAQGKTGNWTLDPNDLTVQVGSGGDVSDDSQSTVGANTVVAALNSTDVTLKAKNSITVSAGIDASGNANAHNLTLVDEDADNNLTVNLNAAITLKSSGVLSGQATLVNVGSAGLIQNGVDVALNGGSVVNVAAGTYAPDVTINKSGLSLIGAPGATINVNPGSAQLDAINIGGGTDGVTVSGFNIVGEITGSYIDYAFGAGISRGVAVANGATNFTITGNTIRNVRNGILIDGRNTGSVTNNVIDNTKGAISVQYTDATGIAITGNSQGSYGNEWGLNLHLNGYYDGTSIHSNPYPGGAAPIGVQTTLLANAAGNDGWAVQDQAYTSSNRTQVVVATTGSSANQGSARAPLDTIQAGINAVVTGGTVNVKNGTYVIPSGGSNYISVGKSLNLIGESEAGVIIDARNASSYGLRIIGGTDGVDLENFTLWGVVASGGYGIKAENTTNLKISNVTSKGAYKAQFDLNGVRGATLDFLTADGTAVTSGIGGSHAGAAIAITDSQDVTLDNSTTQGGAYGGVGIYQSNKPSGYAYQAKDITIASSNSFAESNPVYMEDESATNNFGTVTVNGFGYAAHNNANTADLFTYFQTSAQSAIDMLDTVGAISTGSVEGWTGTAGNNIFTVGFSAASHAMSIQSAIDAALSGGIINVNAGTYAEALNIGKTVDLEGDSNGGTIIAPTALLNTGVGHKYDASVKTAVFVNGASNVTLNNLTIDGGTLGANAVVFWNNASGTISNSSILNETPLNGGQTGQGLAVDATGANTATLLVNNVNFQGWNKNAIDAVNGDGATSGGGNIDLTVQNSTFTGAGNTATIAQNGILVWERGGGTVNLTADGDTFSGLSYNDPATATASGILVYGTSGTTTVKNSTFTNVQDYISTAGGSPREVDATVGNTFDGIDGSTATTAQLFTIADKIIDGIDDSANGMVRLKAGNVYVTAAKGDIQTGIDLATVGDTVNIQDGTYVVASGGSNYLDITKALTVKGQSEAGTIIDASNASAYGLRVQADNVSLSAFTLKGPVGVGGYGIKVEPLENVITPADRVHGFSIANVTETGSYKNGLDLNGVIGATIDHVTVSGTTHGTGIAITDSAGVTLTNNVTTNNAWGGLALYEHNATYDQQVENISVDASNSFGEANGVYMEDESATKDFGSVTIAGFDTAVKATVAPNDSYTWLQNGAQTAIDFAAANAPTLASVQGWTASSGNNIFTVGTSTGGTALSIQAAVDAAASGATVNVNAGTYTGSVALNKANLTLTTADGAVIDAGGAATAVSVSTAANLGTITIDGFTIQGWTSRGINQDYTGWTADTAAVNATNNTVYGPAGGATAHGNGIEVSGNGSVVSGNKVYNDHLNSTDWSGSGIIAVNGSNITIENNIVDGADTGIAVVNWNNIAGMSDITVRGNTVSNALDEGIAVQTFEAAYFSQASGPISNLAITGNTVSDSLSGLGIWDYSPTKDGVWATTISGISGNTFTNNTTQISTDFTGATVTSLLNSNSFDRTVVNNAVGTAIYGDLQTAIDLEDAGSTLNLAGTFGSGANVNKAGDSLVGSAGTVITGSGNGSAITISANDVTVKDLEIDLDPGAAGSGNQLNAVSIGNVDGATVTGVTINGEITGSYLDYAFGSAISRGVAVANGATNVTISGNDIQNVRNGILIDGRNTGSVTGNTIDNTKGAISVQYTDAGAGNTEGYVIDMSGNTQGAIGNEWGLNIHLNGNLVGGTLHANPYPGGAAPDSVGTALLANSAANSGWTVQDQAYTSSNRTAVTVSTTGSDTNQGSQLNALATINAGLEAVVAGGKVNVLTGTYAEDVSIVAPTAVTFNNVTVDSLSVSAGGTILSGSVKAGSVSAAGDIALGGDLSFDTSAVNGTIALANVDGAHDLTLNAGTGVVLAGGIGNATRLGAVAITADLISLGATNKAASFDFNGDVALSAASTVIDTAVSNTAAGNITFAGDIFGTTDGGQSLTLSAGPGTGAKSANGDIAMNNAGIGTLRLGSLNVSGDDFTALTVDLAGGFTSQLTGNQLFAADTLNAAGDVNSNVAGNIGGHIVSGGNVNLTAAGAVSGNITGKVVSLTGQTVNSQVTANILNITAPGGGTITGTFTPGKVSNGLVVNGTTVGAGAGTGNTGTGNTGTGNTGTGGTGNTANNFPTVNGRQLVVEGFALPAGTQIGANGQLILPAGTVIGLLSPGGGTPRVIMVQSVQELGALLDQGYVAIVIDLTGHKKATTRIASN